MSASVSNTMLGAGRDGVLLEEPEFHLRGIEWVVIRAKGLEREVSGLDFKGS